MSYEEEDTCHMSYLEPFNTPSDNLGLDTNSQKSAP